MSPRVGLQRYKGVPSFPDDRDPACVAQFPGSHAAATDKPLHLGLYMDDFVYFSEDPEVERRFKRLLGAKLKVKLMGIVNWFLGTNFEWSHHQDGSLSAHLSQEAYAQSIVETHCLANINFNPSATP